MAVKLGDLYSNLDLEYSGFLTGLKKSVDASASASTSIAKNLQFIRNAAGAVFGAAVVQQAVEIGKRALDYASSLDEVSQQLGVTARDLQIFRYAASQVGVSQEEMDKGLQKFTRTLGEARAGNASAIGTFRELGVSLADIKKGDANAVLLKTADGLSQIKDGANRAAPEVALFGRAGQQLDTLLSGGSSAINDLAKAAEDLGIVLSRDQIENADRTADKISELKQVLEASIAKAVADNAASIYDFVNALERMVVKIPDAIDAVKRFRAELQIKAGQAELGFHYFNIFGGDRRAHGRAQIAAGEAALDDIKAGQQNRQLANLDSNVLGPLLRPDTKGGRTYTDPAAAAAAKRAGEEAAKKLEQQRKKAAQQEDRFQGEKDRYDQQYLSSREQLTSDARLQASYEHQAVDSAAASRDKRYDLDVQEGQLTAAAAAELKRRAAINDELDHSLINRRLDAKLDAEDLATRTAAISNRRDQLTAEGALADTAAERRAIALRLVDLDQEEERLRQQAIIDAKDSTEGERNVARSRLSILPEIYSRRREAVSQQDAGPGGQYLQGLIRTAGQAREALESVEVDGLKGLESGLAGAVSGTEKLGDVFKSVTNQIIADLARIAIQKTIIEPFANKLFGSAVPALGNLDLAPTIKSLNTSIAPTLGFATGGSFQVGGYGGTDSQLMQFWATPGEMVNITKGDGGSRAATHLTVSPSPYFDVAVQEVAAPLADNAAVRGAAGGSALAKRDLAKTRNRTMR